MTAVLTQPDAAFGVGLDLHDLDPKSILKVAETASHMAELGVVKSVIFHNPDALDVAPALSNLGLTPVFDTRDQPEGKHVTAQQLADSGVEAGIVSSQDGASLGFRLVNHGIAPIFALEPPRNQLVYQAKRHIIDTVRLAHDISPQSPARILVSSNKKGPVQDIRLAVKTVYGPAGNGETTPAIYSTHPEVIDGGIGDSAIRAIVQLNPEIDTSDDAKVTADLFSKVQQAAELAAHHGA